MREVADAIAWKVFSTIDSYRALLRQVRPLRDTPCSEDVIDELFQPFNESWPGDAAVQEWRVWAAKFWHFLNPEAFVIADSRVRTFFDFKTSDNSGPIKQYHALLIRFREFALAHEDWLPQLRMVDQGHAEYDSKLWDKIFYQVGAQGSGVCG